MDVGACIACAAAAANPLTGSFNAKCLECAARSLAQSPAFFEANRRQRLTQQYRDALQAKFGEEWERWHKRVKEWAQLIADTRAFWKTT